MVQEESSGIFPHQRISKSLGSMAGITGDGIEPPARARDRTAGRTRKPEHAPGHGEIRRQISRCLSQCEATSFAEPVRAVIPKLCAIFFRCLVSQRLRHPNGPFIRYQRPHKKRDGPGSPEKPSVSPFFRNPRRISYSQQRPRSIVHFGVLSPGLSGTRTLIMARAISWRGKPAVTMQSER